MQYGIDSMIIILSISHTASVQGERATGYGVAVLLTLFGQSSKNPLLQFLGPECEIPANGPDSEAEPPPSKKRKARKGDE